MITANISAYLCLKQLSEYKTVKRKGIEHQRKQPRFDLVSLAGYWPVLDSLKNYQGKIFLNMIPTDKNENRKQDGTTPEYYLQVTPAKSKSINFSGVRFQYQDGKETVFASGEPSTQPKLKGGVVNPMYSRKDDAFLFLFSNDMQVLEILIVSNGRLLIDAYRKQLADGYFSDVLSTLRNQAKPVSSYNRL